MGTIDYTIVIVYLTAIVTLGVMLQKRASAGIDSYFLGNRGMPWWALGASGMASNLDVAGTMINTAWIFALGAAGMFIEIRGGVTLIMAFLMIFMGKWNRRARVMTMAEWMRFRFGKEREGNVARLMAAISIIIVIIAMVTYFAVGSGKFISTFLGLPDIGRVTESLSESEVNEIEGSFAQMDVTRQSVVAEIEAMDLHLPEQRNMEQAWMDLVKKWDRLKENRQRVTSLSQFQNEIIEFGTSAKSLRSSISIHYQRLG